jgi:hypothetical protein
MCANCQLIKKINQQINVRLLSLIWVDVIVYVLVEYHFICTTKLKLFGRTQLVTTRSHIAYVCVFKYVMSSKIF